MQEDQTIHNHSATESNIKMTISTICENWFVTVSTAQKRCKEKNRLLHLVYCASGLRGRPCPVLGSSCLPCSTAAAPWSGGRTGPRGRHRGGDRWKNAQPVPQNSSLSLIWHWHPVHIQCKNQLLPILLMLATRKIPFPSFSRCFTPRSLLQKGMQICSAQKYLR